MDLRFKVDGVLSSVGHVSAWAVACASCSGLSLSVCRVFVLRVVR